MVTTDDLSVRTGDIKVRPRRTGQNTPVILRVDVAGRVRGGDIVARYARRTPRQWVRGEPQLKLPIPGMGGVASRISVPGRDTGRGDG